VSGSRHVEGAALAAEHRLHVPKPLDPIEREQALGWLCHMPGYRELIRQRVSDEQKRRRRLDSTIAARRALKQRRDVDKLGREIEGCG
jgi:hypothetical protein